MIHNILKNKLWLHGSPKQITQLELSHPYNTSDYTNSGLGLFLTKSRKLAKSYAKNGYITTLEVDTSKCYLCESTDFWCDSEPFNEEDIDPMGNYVNLLGSYTREKFLKLGYTTLLYNDTLFDMNYVLVVLDTKVAKIVTCNKI